MNCQWESMGENEQIYDEDGDVIITSKWPGEAHVIF